mgnify:CR=1 FL=1
MGRALRILIIDDDELDRKGLVQALARQGYARISCAGNGAEGMQMMTQGDDPPRIVLVDLVLPGPDGFDICRQIRGLPGGARVKIILITGHLEAVDVARARVSGADEILEKRAGFRDVHVTIERLLREDPS